MRRSSLSLPRVAVIGGGAIGLASAWALARAGARVTVLEAGPEAGQGALAASGGMLAQGFEGANENAGRAFVALAAQSLDLWDEWAEQLNPYAETPLGYRRTGSLVPAVTQADQGWISALAESSARHGIIFERLDAAQAREHEPHLSPEVLSALRFPGDGEVDNRALGRALAGAVRAAGGDIRTGWPVMRVSPDAAGVTVTGPAGVFTCDRVVLAAGWQSAALAEDIPEAASIMPVKGQMISLQPVVDLSGCIRAARAYLSAKPGRIVVGATSTANRSDDRADDAATRTLCRHAGALVPALAGAAVTDVWTGVRPGTFDGLPLIGPSACRGVILGLGAYRNGVLLAPAMADLIRNAVLGEADIDAAFDPQRPLTALTQG
ncbi:MAG: glycine oxidase ThiO [Maricaulis sp.]|nr:glycine oxidase ThiO [Maricaulis sp.]